LVSGSEVCGRHSLIAFRSLWKYARYFAKRHPKVIEDEKAVEVVIRLEEGVVPGGADIGRRMTVRTIRTMSVNTVDNNDEAISPLHHIESTSYRVVTEPEPAHVAMDTPAMQREGIAATDYFFESQEPVDASSVGKVKEAHLRRKRSFGAWCKG
jgi:hypothetical protein